MGNAPSWGYFSSNLAAVATAPGTAVNTNSGDTNESTPVSLIAAITHDVEYLQIGIAGCFSGGTNVDQRCTFDIVIDPAGGTSWDTTNPIITGLLAGHTSSMAATSACPLWYHFPLWLPSGCSIGTRVRASQTTQITTPRVILNAYGGNKNPESWWCGRTVETIGITDDATCAGTSHTAGSSNAWSTPGNVGSTMVGECGAVQFGLQCQVGTQTATQYLFEFGVGSLPASAQASALQRVGPPIFAQGGTAENGGFTPPGPIFTQQPSGTQWQVHGLCGGTAIAFGAGVYAVH